MGATDAKFLGERHARYGKVGARILAELATPLILIFPDWDAIADGSRPFHVYCDACIDGFGATLEQE